eukprot:CAMPEP_0197009296 /NCGR_PEP_ID=MMETSP1380-20130617/49474_1 /TAXON_ID=5936 /ORGANISM="Euplotes crassus, Strain CT5" /LENGTH=82 /DNA_ID=CAMNT_0042430447 /DNA_START=18 /DNA_END=262 /DNA_ORIENTATION=-
MILRVEREETKEEETDKLGLRRGEQEYEGVEIKTYLRAVRLNLGMKKAAKKRFSPFRVRQQRKTITVKFEEESKEESQFETP